MDKDILLQFGLDFYVISRHATHGDSVFRWLQHFAGHFPVSIAHAAVIMFLWVVSGLLAGSFDDHVATESDAVAAATRASAVFGPCLGLYYGIGAFFGLEVF